MVKKYHSSKRQINGIGRKGHKGEKMEPIKENRENKPLHSVKLPESLIKKCSNLPETGMGYQKVNCKVSKDGKEVNINGIVLNCSILETVEPVQIENILDISIT